MSLEEWRDLVVYQLNDDGLEEEVPEVETQKLKAELTSERVLLICRYDIRKIYIWKGPKSPVRKRFISSRVASRLQELATSQRGMHMKIVSVDAGDEPIDFLQAFDLTSYEVTEEDKPEDMYYITNLEKQKLAEAEAAKQREAQAQEKQEYWSPLLEEQKKGEKKGATVDLTAEKVKAMQKMKEMEAAAPVTPKPVSTSAPAPATTPRPAAKTVQQPIGINQQDMENTLKELTSNQVPADFKRLNIIIGTSLFGPSIIKQQVFGKEIEKEKWDMINSIPDGRIEIDTRKLIIYAKNNQITAIEVLKDACGDVIEKPIEKKVEQKEKSECAEPVSTNATEAKKSGRRSLPSIPKA